MDETTDVISDLLTTPSPSTSYRSNVHRSLSSRLPRAITDKLITKSWPRTRTNTHRGRESLNSTTAVSSKHPRRHARLVTDILARILARKLIRHVRHARFPVVRMSRGCYQENWCRLRIRITRHTAHSVKTLRQPQNRKYVTVSQRRQRKTESNGRTPQSTCTEKSGEVRPRSFRDVRANRQIDMHTHHITGTPVRSRLTILCFYYAPIEMRSVVFICSVGLFVRQHNLGGSELQVQTSRNFLCLLPVAIWFGPPLVVL